MPAIIIALSLNTYIYGTHGITFSLSGIITGSLIMLVPFIMKGIGGGDLKMLAAIGAFGGYEFVIYTFLSASIAGGIFALIHTIAKKRQKEVCLNMKNMALAQMICPGSAIDNHNDHEGALPYACAIATGTLIMLGMTYFA